jgi:nucleoid DNA-binding protein
MAAKKPSQPSPRPLTQQAFLAELAKTSGLTVQQITQVFDGLGKLIKRELRKKGPGEITVARLFKVRRVRTRAIPARKGINPFTKDVIVIAGKPARISVRLRALKKLKDLVG